jgi:predicted ArsR family transcriptional regulator
MGLKLVLLWGWTPKWIITRELANVADVTSGALLQVLQDHAPDAAAKFGVSVAPRGLEEKRVAMAKTHTTLVCALVDALGREEAVRLGRNAMFKAGQALGEQTRTRLGVKTASDMFRAAKVLYRVLGISFTIQQVTHEIAVMEVHRCTLASEYSELTCTVLSAADEGVIHGLYPKAQMTFKDKITGGCTRCTAEIKFGEENP